MQGCCTAPGVAGNAGERVQRVQRRQGLRRATEGQVQVREVGQEGGPGRGAGGSVVFLRQLQRGDGGGHGRRAEPVESLRAAHLLPVLRRRAAEGQPRYKTRATSYKASQHVRHSDQLVYSLVTHAMQSGVNTHLGHVPPVCRNLNEVVPLVGQRYVRQSRQAQQLPEPRQQAL